MRGTGAPGRRAALWASIVAVLSLSSVAHAGTGVWTTGGPYGGTVQALAIDPKNPATLYAATEWSGIFKSFDAGATWSTKNIGLTDLPVRALAIDSRDPTTLYAGVYFEGVFKSTDAGDTWTDTHLRVGGVSALAIDPTTPTTIYAGADRGGGVLRSTDAGGTWARVVAGLTDQNVLALAIDPTTPTTLYAGTAGGGIFKSVDSGGTWTATDLGVGPYTVVRTLIVDPRNAATLYAGLDYHGVLKSTDSGAHWTAANTGLDDLHYVRVLTFDPRNPTTLYAGTWGRGVYKTTDSGGTWSAARDGLTCRTVNALAVDPTNAVTLYAGMFLGGVFKSTDSGGGWLAANTGLLTLAVMALAIDPTNPATLYAGAWDGGVVKSTDSGATWVPPLGGLMDLAVNTLAIDPRNPSTLYAGTWYKGVFKSTDAGATWSATNTGLTNVDVLSLAVDPVTPATLYAGTYVGGVHRSTDSGATWSPANTGLTTLTVGALAVDPATPTTLYAGGGGIFKSVDSGGSWAAVNAGLTSPWVYALAIDPTNPATLYAGTYGGVFRSTDAGGRWAVVNPDPIVHALAVHPRIPSTLYAGTWEGGVVKSTDSGGTWTAVHAGLPHRPVRALALDPTGEGTVYAGLYNRGVWQSNVPTGGVSDLALTLSDSPDPVIGTTPLTYSLAVANGGPDFASSVSVSLTLPPGTSFAGTYGYPWNCREAGGVVTCTRPSLAAGTTSTFTVEVTPGLEPTVLVSSATVAAAEADPNTTNNLDSETTTVKAPPIWIGTRTKTVLADSGEFAVNGGVTYIITLTNTGAATQADNPGHELVDILPWSLNLLSADATSGTTVSDLPGNTVTWDGSLPSGGSVTVTIRARIGPRVPLRTFVANQAEIHYDFDGDGTNEATTLTDDPGAPGESDYSAFVVVSATMDFYTLPPCRLLDTRNARDTFGGPALAAGAIRVFPLVGRCDVPLTARAVSVNLTVTEPTAPGSLQIYPADTPLPDATSLDYSAGQTRANNAVVALNGLGELAVRCVQASGTAHLILDVNGYFE